MSTNKRRRRTRSRAGRQARDAEDHLRTDRPQPVDGVAGAARRRDAQARKPATRSPKRPAQLGYVPDRAGVRLRTGKTNVIALVLDGADESIDFARHLIQGIGHAIEGTRYHLT